MALLKDTLASEQWPQGGTLKAIAASTLYGTAGAALKDTPAGASWPPSFGASPTKYGLLLIVYGGTAGNLSGNTMSVVWDYIDISPFKLNDGGTLMASIRAVRPDCKVLLYKAIAEMEIAPANTAAAIRYSTTPIVYNEALAHDAGAASNDKWILRDASNNPVLAYGYTTTYGVDLGTPSIAAREISNLQDACSVIGADGIWFDNVLAERPNAAITKYTTEDAWENAIIANVKAIGDGLRAGGLIVFGNSFKYRANDSRSDDATFIKEWWDRIGGSFDAKMNEGWMATSADRTRLRKDQAGWQDYYRNYADLVVHEQTVNARGANPAQTVPSTATAYMEQLMYGRAAFLLGWDGVKGAYAPFVQGGDALHVNYTFDVGAPISAQAEIQTSVFRRYYQKALVVLNSHPTNSYSLTASPDGRVYTYPDGSAVTYPINIASGRAITLKTTSGGGGSAASKTEAFTDNYDDGSLASQWTATTPTGTTVVESGGVVTLHNNANNQQKAILELAASDLVSSFLTLQFSPGAITVAGQEAEISVYLDANNQYLFRAAWNGSARVLRVFRIVGGVSTQLLEITGYDPTTTHKYLRIRETAGTIYFDTAQTYGTWTNRFNEAAQFNLYNIKIRATVGATNATSPALDLVIDNFNINPATAQSYSAEILAEPNLVAYYRLGEAAGASQALDSKGTRHSTAKGAGVTFGAAALISGDSDTAAAFDGTAGASIAMPSPGITGGSWAIEAWAKQVAPGSVAPAGYDTIMGYGFGNTPITGRILWSSATGVDTRILAQFSNVSLFSNPAQVTNPSVGARHHIVVEFNNTDKKLYMYVDGTQVAVSAAIAAGSEPVFNAAWFVGTYNSLNEAYMFNGSIDEIAIYNSILGATKVASHYTNGTT